MKNIKISKEISLPIDVVTQTLATIGRKGAGKTYLATMIAEQMLDAGSQVIVIDPVGNWWGLRVGADGKSKGKDIFVIGGEHGDIPIVPEAGAKIAKLLVEKSISAVLDVSSFRLGERKRFCTDFGEELLHLKKTQKNPVHLFLEEAQLIIPQRVGPEEARMVGAFEQIVRLGRNYGIGCTLVTQRPQSVNKEVLSQVECLCVLQVTGPHERKALEDWVQEAGADRKLIGELPGLERGEGYIWSPSWLRIYQRVHFSKKETFDASATPTVGTKTKSVLLSKKDVDQLREDMKEVVAQAEKDNPVALRRKISELEKELKNNKSETAMGASQWLDYGKKYGYADFFKTKINQEAGKQWEKILDYWIAWGKSLAKIIQEIEESIPFEYEAEPDRKIPEGWMTPSNLEEARIKEVIPIPKNFYSQSPAQKVEKAMLENSSFGKCAKAIYSYLVMSAKPMTKTQIAVATGYSQNSGGFNNSLSELSSASLITRMPSLIQLNGLIHQDMLVYVNTSLEKWLPKLGACSRKIWEFMLEHQSHGSISKEDIAAETGYSATSGGFNNSLSELSALGLVERVPGGIIRINPEILEL